MWKPLDESLNKSLKELLNSEIIHGTVTGKNTRDIHVRIPGSNHAKILPENPAEVLVDILEWMPGGIIGGILGDTFKRKYFQRNWSKNSWRNPGKILWKSSIDVKKKTAKWWSNTVNVKSISMRYEMCESSKRFQKLLCFDLIYAAISWKGPNFFYLIFILFSSSTNSIMFLPYMFKLW